MPDAKPNPSNAAPEAREALLEFGKASGLLDPDIESDPQLSKRVREILDHLADDEVIGLAGRVRQEQSVTEIDIDGFADAHAISRAEKRLLAAVVEGASVSRYAQSTGVSINTVRTHMRRLLEKTGTSSQLELLRKVFRNGT